VDSVTWTVLSQEPGRDELSIVKAGIFLLRAQREDLMQLTQQELFLSDVLYTRAGI